MWIVGGVVIVVALIALIAWLRVRSTQEPPPPELTDPESGPPEERDPTWDPRRRYDDE